MVDGKLKNKHWPDLYLDLLGTLFRVRPDSAHNIVTRCYHYLLDQLSRQLSRTRVLNMHFQSVDSFYEILSASGRSVSDGESRINFYYMNNKLLVYLK